WDSGRKNNARPPDAPRGQVLRSVQRPRRAHRRGGPRARQHDRHLPRSRGARAAHRQRRARRRQDHHETITPLHKTFITPFDRDQIHQLINTMDDILDLIQDVAESVALYDLRSVTPEAKQLAEICQMCCDRVQTVVGLLTDVKRSEAILKCCEEIDRLESDADRVMRSALSKLFREENDLKQVMK